MFPNILFAALEKKGLLCACLTIDWLGHASRIVLLYVEISPDARGRVIVPGKSPLLTEWICGIQASLYLLFL